MRPAVPVLPPDRCRTRGGRWRPARASGPARRGPTGRASRRHGSACPRRAGSGRRTRQDGRGPRAAIRVGAARVHLDGDGAGQLQGAAGTRVEPELQSRVERQPLAYPGQHAGRHPAQRRAVQNGTNDSRSTQSGREQAVPLDACRSPVATDHVVYERVQRRAAPAGDRGVQHRAQGEGVRAGLHEPGPVRGVLHPVGEDQRLLLLRVEAAVAEQGGQRHRQQRGDARCRGTGCRPAGGRTGQVSSRASLVGVRADGGEHRQDPARRAGRGRRRAGRRRAVPGRGPRTRPARPGACAPSSRGVGFGRARTAAARNASFAGGVVAPDALVVGGEVGADRRERDTPAGTAAVPAVDGRKRRPESSVSPPGTGGPSSPQRNAGGGVSGAVDPGELAHPQMHVDSEGVPSSHRPDVPEGRHHVPISPATSRCRSRPPRGVRRAASA